MNRAHEILIGPLCLALLAAAFCVWSAFGNDVNLCVTAGCSLYQDSSLAGISLWWLGAGVFALLGLLALLGAAALGRALAGLALLGDICLLLLMALTAPCVSCLVAALFFALCYLSFRQAVTTRGRETKTRHSLLVLVWLLLFAVNLGAVARSQADVWSITDNSGEATVRMFFSPSCPSCREGVDILSGHVDVAFYPLAENEADIYKVAQMRLLLDQGQSMAEALAGSQETVVPRGLAAWSPDMLLLRFRMLRNKAHVFASGSQSVPFFEYHGLPAMLLKQNQARQPRAQSAPAPDRSGAGQAPFTPPFSLSPPSSPPFSQDGQDATLPLEPQVAGQCGGATPCP